MKNLIQVAGVIDREEADLLVRLGVAWLGFPLRLPVHKEDLPETEAGRIIRALPGAAAGVVITYEDTAEKVVGLCRKLGARHVQLHGDISRDELGQLRALWPDLFVMKSLIVGNGRGGLDSLRAQIRAQSGLVDAFITDTYDPESGACGATGKVHDWTVSRRLVEISPEPIILAGGLNADNVCEAIQAVRPAGVDVHTGVEGPDGRKDADLVAAFVREARRGFAEVERNRMLRS